VTVHQRLGDEHALHASVTSPRRWIRRTCPRKPAASGCGCSKVHGVQLDVGHTGAAPSCSWPFAHNGVRLQGRTRLSFDQLVHHGRGRRRAPSIGRGGGHMERRWACLVACPSRARCGRPRRRLRRRSLKVWLARPRSYLRTIESSTRRWEADPVGMAADLAQHDELLRRAVRGAAGEVFTHTGDGLGAAFPTPAAAVAAAVDGQLALARARWSCAAPLRVRTAARRTISARRSAALPG